MLSIVGAMFLEILCCLLIIRSINSAPFNSSCYFNDDITVGDGSCSTPNVGGGDVFLMGDYIQMG